MAISASSIASSSTLNELRTQFNNLVTDVTAIEGGSISYTTLNTTTTNATTLNVKEDGTIVFEGATDDGFETTLTVVDPTADRTVTFPNASGTVIVSDSSTNVTTLPDDLLIKDGGTIGNASVADVLTLASTGIVTFKDDIILKDAATIGVASSTSAISIASTGIVTFVDDIIIKDGGTIGSASDTDAIAISSGGVVTMNQIPVFSAGINVSGGNIAGTLSTAAQANITSLGTLTALTVDDVAVDGKEITMTGSASDTAVFTAGTNGTLDITTTDAAAAAANITITADGTAELAGTTVTLNSGGDIVLDADGADVVFKDGGTTIATHSNSSSDYVITTGVQDKDFVIKGNDGGSTITPLTVDMSDYGKLYLTGGLIDLKNSGSVSEIKFYCESSNAHAQSLVGAPHSEGATNTLTLPGTGGDARLVSRSSTDTLTNKTLTSPKINEDVAVTATATEINKLDGVGTLAQAGKHTIWVPANAMTPTASNGCSILTTVETTSGRPDMNVLDFDKDSDEFAQFSVAFPKSWNAGTITFQFFWSGIAATTGVAMNLQGVSFADNDSIDTAYGTAVVVQDDAQGAVEELLVSAESGAVTIAGSPGDNELCYFRIGRDVSDGNDDMAGDCRLHGVKLFYTTDAANDA